MKLPLDSSVPALRPCRYCGGEFGLVDAKRGPHNHGIRCSTCLRHLGWTPPDWRPLVIDTGVNIPDNDDLFEEPDFDVVDSGDIY